MRSLWQFLRGRKSAQPGAAPGQPAGRQKECEPPPYRLDVRAQAFAALTRSGWSRGTDSDVDFFLAAVGSDPFAKPIDLRRHGMLMAADELRQLGLRANTVVSREFMAILTDKGRAQPIEAAHHIMSMSYTLRAGARARANQAAAGISMVQVIPNSMAAGPCAACLALSKSPIPLSSAPDGPLPECPHPDQCKLFTRSVLLFD